MKPKVYEFKKKREEKEKNGVDARRTIAPDLPFDYDEVTSITAPEYVSNLHRDGIAILPNAELKRNMADFLLKTIEKPKSTRVSGFRVVDNYYHHVGHAWVHLLHDGWARVGIDDFTTKVFGPADAINLPQVGDFLMQGDVGWELIRNRRRAPMQSPMSGIVFAVNNRIKAQPEITHNDPYGDGWLLILNPVSLEINLKELCLEKACAQWVERENQRLLELLGAKYRRLAATGGQLIDDIFGQLPGIDWDLLVDTFLRT